MFTSPRTNELSSLLGPDNLQTAVLVVFTDQSGKCNLSYSSFSCFRKAQLLCRYLADTSLTLERYHFVIGPITSLLGGWNEVFQTSFLFLYIWSIG